MPDTDERNQRIVFPEPGRAVLDEGARPEPGPGEVLVRTDRTLISTGTELTILGGAFPDGSHWDDYAEYPFEPGYVNVGTVVEVGGEGDGTAADQSTADGETPLAPGTRVATWESHARFVTPAAADCVVVPDGVGDDPASLFAIAQIVMQGLRRGRISFGETVAVFGLGLLGQLATRLAILAGAQTVLAVDPADERRGYLPDHPAVAAVDPGVESPADAIDRVAGRRADLVLEVTGNPDAIPGEFDVLRQQGRLVLLSSPHGETTLDFHDAVNAPSTEIVGAHQLSHPERETPSTPWPKARHAALYFDYVDRGRLDVAGLASHTVSPADAPALYDRLLDDRTRAMAARIDW